MPGENNFKAGDLVGAIATGGSSFLGSLVGYSSARNLAELQNKYNLEQWNRENAYNTPKAQMERFREAGLNPNLIVGQQNLAAQSPQMMSGVPMDMSGLPDAVRQGALLDSQIDLNNANADKLRHQAGLFDSQVSLNASKEDLNEILGQEVAQRVENLKVTRENIIAQTDLIKARTEFTNEQALGQHIDNQFAERKNEAQIQKLEAECHKLGVDAKRVMTLMYAELANIQADTAYLNQCTKKEKMMAGVLANTFQSGKIDLDFIKDHPDLHAFGQGAKEIIPSVDALSTFIGNAGDLIFPTKRAVAVLRGVKP